MAEGKKQALWTKEQIQDVVVGEADTTHFNYLATIFEKDPNYSQMFDKLFTNIGLKESDLAMLPEIKKKMFLELTTPYATYRDLLNRWKSSSGNEATFGVLNKVLEEIQWIAPIDKILAYKWKNVSLPKSGVSADEQQNLQFTEVDHGNDEAVSTRLIHFSGEDLDGIAHGIDWVGGQPLIVKVVKAEALHEGPECYKMTSNPRGLVLIINNEFKNKVNERKGSESDVIYIRDLFRQMKYKVYGVLNVKSTEFKSILKTFKKLITKEIDSLVVVIMSHGEFGFIYMEDEGGNNKIDIHTDLIDEFSHAKCPLMKGKPKVFLFQACQNIPKREEQDSVDNLPISDIIICFPSFPGQVAYRNPKIGSRYIYVLVKVFMENAHQHDIEYMLKKLVIQEMNDMKLGPKAERQVPSVQTIGQFIKLYFNPL